MTASLAELTKRVADLEQLVAMLVDPSSLLAETRKDYVAADALKANIASPTFTGIPAAPTAAADTNTTQIATTAHVFAERSNAATLTNKTLTGPIMTAPVLGTPASGVATNLTGTASGLTAGNVTTNANLTGEVTSVGNAATLTNSAVIGKVLTGYTSGAGTVASTDTILQAIQKLNGNDATNANLTGPITSVGNATAVASQTGTGSTFAMSAGPTFTGTLSAATVAASGTVGSQATNIGFEHAKPAVTTYLYSYMQNLSGFSVFGVEGSSAALITGATAYDTVVRGKTGIAFSGNDGVGMQMRLTSGGLAITGVVSTTDPAGGAGPLWKLGVAASVSPTSPNRTLRVDIAGTSYYIHAKTTND